MYDFVKRYAVSNLLTSVFTKIVSLLSCANFFDCTFEIKIRATKDLVIVEHKH